MSEADEYGPGGAYEMGQDQAHDATGAVECPDCGADWIPAYEPRCPSCGLSADDLAAAADFVLGLGDEELR